MKQLSIFIFICFTIFSCAEESTRPANILEPEKMSEVLVEVQLLEATYNIQYSRLDSSKAIMIKGFDQLFEKTGVNRETFETSIQYYSLRPSEMIAIQEDVADLLLARESEIKSDK
jgi:hypothetical protein